MHVNIHHQLDGKIMELWHIYLKEYSSTMKMNKLQLQVSKMNNTHNIEWKKSNIKECILHKVQKEEKLIYVDRRQNSGHSWGGILVIERGASIPLHFVPLVTPGLWLCTLICQPGVSLFNKELRVRVGVLVVFNVLETISSWTPLLETVRWLLIQTSVYFV